MTLQKNKKTVLGLMSGTSLDGLDVVGVDLWEEDGRIAHGEVCQQAFPYPPALKTAAFHLSQGRALGPGDILFLHHDLGQWMAASAAEAVQGWGFKKVDLVGLHGQTVWHEPSRQSAGQTQGATWQLAEPAYLAKALACPVVFDFRCNDMVLGGQGAPLAPLGQSLMLKEEELGTPLLTLNIGGISNGAIFQKGLDLKASDFGPGMVWLDACLGLYGHSQSIDEGGQLASQGALDEEFLQRLTEWDVFQQQPLPKSTGREHYQEEALVQLLSGPNQSKPSLPDALKTLSHFSARAIASGFHALGLAIGERARFCISGGGSQHQVLVEELMGFLEGSEKYTPEEIFGVGSQAMEGLCFALLAYARWGGKRLFYPGVTGVSEPVLYGKICEV